MPKDTYRAAVQHRRCSVVERGPLDPPSRLPDDDVMAVTANPFATDQKLSFAQRINGGERPGHGSRSVRSSISLEPGEVMAPPPTPGGGDDVWLTRSSRSTSSASRNMNRLSITLPIAPPTCDPTRPVPTSALSTLPPSFPSTPAESISSQTVGPTEKNEFIIAIAAQERRVMELREELQRAEKELKSLKQQFTQHDAGKNEAGDRRHATEPMRPLPARAENRASHTSTPSEDDLPPRRSVDLDRRRQILQSQQNTPKEGHRRVFTGKHTRTLSLLSPAKTDGGDFSVLEDKDLCKSPSVEHHRNAPPLHPHLTKRMTWQPRSSHSAGATPGSAAMSQIVEDFKLGFRTFYEDIRQITVGDEPVNGNRNVTRSTAVDLSRGSRSYAEDQETIRPAQAARPRVNTAFDSPVAIETPTRLRPSNANRDRVNPRKPKHFSWTPLSFDSVDGDAWLSFDSPSSGKSTRWSGSTMNDESNDAVQSTVEKGHESDTPL